jgi:NAD(P)-dependent dehydrogenase (short-subunit alcohol dehydrogenase family)
VGNRLEGKVAIVTGAGTKLPGIGIGCAIAQTLGGQGASVLIVDLDEENGKATLDLVEQAGGKGSVFVADVSKESECEAMIGAAVDTFGKLDILVNNAGISLHVPVTETSLELYERILGVNLRGPFMACKYAIPVLIAGGGGSIVNIGSVVAIRDSGSSHPAYAASKGGVNALTIDLAGEYGRDNVRVNCVLPGMIASPIQQSVGSASAEIIKRMNALGRMGGVFDIAHAVEWLCTDEASYMTGHILPVDGGATVSMPATVSRVDRREQNA